VAIDDGTATRDAALRLLARDVFAELPNEGVAAGTLCLRAKDRGFDIDLKEAQSWIRLARNQSAKARPARNGSAPAEATSEAPPFHPPAHWQRLDLAELSSWKVPPLEPIIDGLVARGNLVYLAAQSQTGKTLLAAYIARQLTNPGKLFGRYTITPVSAVLYLVLEDPGRRLKDRLLDMETEFEGAGVLPGDVVFLVAAGFVLTDPRHFEWLHNLITSEGFDVVFLDTYQRATPGIGSFDDEQQSVILHRCANLTRETGCALFVLDHLRKGQGNQKRAAELSIDDIKGTGGKAQNADGVLLMQRTPNRKQIRLMASSKDFDVPVRVLLDVAPAGSTGPKFTIAGDLDQLAAEASERGEKTRRRILAVMPAGVFMTSGEIATRVKLGRTTVSGHLRQLAASQEVEHNGKDGKWRMYRVPAGNLSAAMNNDLPLQDNGR
jgi:hypothetical protein